ncbi:a-amylase [Gongronella butleri]|nr:a-amylase [Gongronella butleri]
MLMKRAAADAWSQRTVYQLLTDRFAQSDDTTSACSDLSSYCGGTFKGVMNHLDYIQGMGFDAIWISPIPTNIDGGYHGYWAKDFDTINSNFGTGDDLKALVDAAHKLGMYVMLDVVANHMGIPSTANDYSGYTFDTSSDYHPKCTIDESSQTSMEQCWLANLPDINTEDDTIVAKLNSVVKNWVDTYGFDGLRIDTMKYIRKDFWPGYIDAAGVFAIGEVYDGDPSYTTTYFDYSPGLLNYPVYFPVYDTFTLAKDMTRLHNGWTAALNVSGVWANFIDNHDVPRLLGENKDAALTKNALTFSLMSTGLGIVYYGTEQSFNGGADPNNREVLWTSGFSTDTDMYSFVTTLVKKGRQATLNGTIDAFGGMTSDNKAYAFSRGNALVVLNQYGASATQDITISSGKLADGTTLTDIFSGQNVTINNSQVTFTIKNGMPAVFV